MSRRHRRRMPPIWWTDHELRVNPDWFAVRRELLDLAFDVQPGENAVDPPREPPVGLAQQLHRRRYEHHADDGGVDEHRGGESQTEQLEHAVVAEHERHEDG